MQMENYLVYAETIHGSTLKTTIESLKETFYEVPLRFSRREGVTIHASEKGRPIHSIIRLDRAMFPTFHMAEDEEVFNLDMTKLNRALKSCNSNEVITIYVTYDNENVVYIQRYDDKHQKLKTFGISTDDIDDPLDAKDRLDLENRFMAQDSGEAYRIPCSVFVQSCKDATLIQSEYIELGAQGDHFVINARDANKQMYYEEKVLVKSRDGPAPPVGHRYSLHYLNSANKCASLCTDILIRIGPSGDLIMEYMIDINQHDRSHSYISFLLDPTVDPSAAPPSRLPAPEDSDAE